MNVLICQDFEMIFIFKVIPVPLKFLYLVDLAIASLLMPMNVSFAGMKKNNINININLNFNLFKIAHLSGIIVGNLFVHGPLKTLIDCLCLKIKNVSEFIRSLLIRSNQETQIEIIQV